MLRFNFDFVQKIYDNFYKIRLILNESITNICGFINLRNKYFASVYHQIYMCLTKTSFIFVFLIRIYSNL